MHTEHMYHGCAALQSVAAGRGWLEIFHSAPTWPDALITYRMSACLSSSSLSSSPSPSPSPSRSLSTTISTYESENSLSDGSAVTRRLINAMDRPGFRVFRLQLPYIPAESDATIRFRLRPSNPAIPGVSAVTYHIPAQPGRYVVMSGHSSCSRVASPDVPQCLTAYRPRDCFVEIMFVVDLDRPWKQCFISYCFHRYGAQNTDDDDHNWHKRKMTLRPQIHSNHAQLHQTQTPVQLTTSPQMPHTTAHSSDTHAHWFVRLECKAGLDCVFTDGQQQWDNNTGKNYVVPMPGQYLVENTSILYLGPTQLDRHLQNN